jgi:hypothetical protein
LTNYAFNARQLSVFFFLSILIFPVHPILISCATIISCYSLSFNLPFFPPHTILKVFPSSVITRPSPPAFPPQHPPFLTFQFLPPEALPIEAPTTCLQIFNACQLFSPNLYLANDDERTRITEEWSKWFFVKFQTPEEEQDRCRGECLEN